MNSRTFLSASLVSNLILIAALAYALQRQKPAPGSSGNHTAQTPAAIQTNTLPTSTNTTANESRKPKMFDWQSVESEDYRKYIANLRAIGCPEETIRDIIVADVNKLFDARKDKLRVTRKKFEYWKASSMMNAMADEESVKLKQELNREKRELLTELLGSAPPEKPDASSLLSPLETMMDFLPSGKQTEVLEAMQRYQAKLMKTISNGAPDAEDQKKMVAIQKEMESELAKIMTPQEFENYQLRLSQTSMMMRMQLAVFEPSEQEFKDLFKIRKAFEDEFPLMGNGTLDKDQRARRDALQKETDDKVKSLLGEDRFKEYQRAQDYNYQTIAKTADRFNLAKDSAVKVFDMKNIAEEQAQKVRSDSRLASNQKEAALQAIRAETERSVREVFGEKAFESYQKQAGNWIDRLAPPPPTPTPVVPTP